MLKKSIVSLIILAACLSCGEEEKESQSTFHHCELELLDGVDADACIDYELAAIMSSQLDTISAGCTDPGGEWFENSPCAVPAGTRGCKQVVLFAEIITWYSGTFYTDEFWAADSINEEGKTNEEERKTQCESPDDDDDSDEESSVGVWVVK